MPAAGGTPFATLSPAPPNVYRIPAARELVSVGPLPVSEGGHARPPPHPAVSRPWSAHALPVCKTALPAPGTVPPSTPGGKTALPAHGTSLPRPPGGKTALPAHGIGQSPPPVCKSALYAHGTSPSPPPVCKTALPAHGPGQCGQVECVTGMKDKCIQ